jgi:RNA polymerase sigma-70 factor (ECF subfamily)
MSAEHVAPLADQGLGPGAESGRKEVLGADADDARLARAALAGQVWAQREIWFRFAPMVYSLFSRALSPRHDPDDLTQEVFLRVFRMLHTLQKASALRSFVYSIAVRVVSEEVGRFACRRRIIEQKPVLPTPSTSSPADFEIRETMLCVRRILDGMPDQHRVVLILRHVEDMKLKEIALCLGISVATVKRHLNGAVAFIQESLAKEEGRAWTDLGTGRPARLCAGGQ